MFPERNQRSVGAEAVLLRGCCLSRTRLFTVITLIVLGIFAIVAGIVLSSVLGCHCIGSGFVIIGFLLIALGSCQIFMSFKLFEIQRDRNICFTKNKIEQYETQLMQLEHEERTLSEKREVNRFLIAELSKQPQELMDLSSFGRNIFTSKISRNGNRGFSIRT